MAIINDSPVRGSRISKVTFSRSLLIQDQQQGGAGPALQAIGQGDVGMPMRGAGKFLGMFVACQWAGGTNNQTITVTALKNGAAAGNRFFSTQLVQTGAASGTNAVDNTTPAIAANCEFAAGDDLILVIATSATTGDVKNIFVSLDYEALI